jgi:hypothetical protein
MVASLAQDAEIRRLNVITSDQSGILYQSELELDVFFYLIPYLICRKYYLHFPSNAAEIQIRKLAQIEEQMQSLSNRVAPEAVALLQLQQQGSQNVNLLASPYSPDFQHSTTVESPNSFVSSNRPADFHQDNPFPCLNTQPSKPKRKRGDFEVTVDQSLDVVTKGLISHEDAMLYFQTFFQGCVGLPSLFLGKSSRLRINMSQYSPTSMTLSPL